MDKQPQSTVIQWDAVDNMSAFYEEIACDNTIIVIDYISYTLMCWKIDFIKICNDFEK